MKKINSLFVAACFFLLLLPLSAVQAQTEDDDDYRNEQEYRQKILAGNPNRILKVHPLQLGEIYLAYERVRAGDVSNELGLSYIYRTYLKDGDSNLSRDKARDTKGLALRMEQRHYTSKEGNAPYGFFHGPFFGYRFLLFDDSSYEIFNQPEPDVNDPDARYIGRLFLNTFDLAYRFGYQFRLNKHFALEVAGGLGVRAKYGYSKNANELLQDLFVGKEITSQRNGVLLATALPQFKVALGYSFR
ncbi:ABC transporter ATP-binding protein [Botryobacter ruber]|uniref:ABC transporter ATP-binding protein n=1 Tax=Botryobacter ruber TaxID=2171629 RepID=UPI000E0C88C2|nr:ABC transporter ATP-binding protein [Botryobacter ruber]